MSQNRKPEPIPSAALHEASQAEARLRQIGIPGSEPLVQAVRAGVAGARATTPVHPRSMGGLRMWGDCVAASRERLAPHGWTSEVIHGVELVVAPHRDVAFTVTASDAGAGRPEGNPQVRYERATVIERLVNGTPANLFSDAEPPPFQLWMLLHYLTRTGVAAELGRPSAIGEAGLVTSWLERILLPDINGTWATRMAPPAVTPPVVDVDVSRRATGST